jgi:hypothetical protein
MKAALRAQRERVIERLGEGFVRDELGLDEFERRVDEAHGAQDVDALGALVADLEPALARALPTLPASPAARDGAAQPALAKAHSGALAPVSAGAPDSLAIFGNVERRGRYRLADGSRALAVFGNVELDLRDVTLAIGVTTLHVRAVFGNIEIVVPPELPVECIGSGIFGSFASVHRVAPEGHEGQAVLRIVGQAVLGNVEVLTRPRGARLLPR